MPRQAEPTMITIDNPRSEGQILGWSYTVAFMDAGVIVESGPPGEMLSRPRHERTRAFLARVIGARQ